MRIIIYSAFFVLFTCLESVAQSLEGGVGFHGFADNREYSASQRESKTIFGARISPQVGLLVDSLHRIRVGTDLLHEFGSTKAVEKVDPIVYYQFTNNSWDFYLGSFPRYGLLDDYPRMQLNDTFLYYRPNIGGMLLKYETPKFRQTVWIDWTGKQTVTSRETFLFGFSGNYKPGKFFVSHYAYMFHNAFSKVVPADQYLQDNGAIQIHAGLAFSNIAFLDSLSIATGAAMSLERTRGLTEFSLPIGSVTDLKIAYKRFSLDNSFYVGEGHHLINGDSFYTSKVYNRLDLGWTPILFNNIEGKFKFTLHFVDNVMDNQQTFSLRYNIMGRERLQ